MKKIIIVAIFVLSANMLMAQSKEPSKYVKHQIEVLTKADLGLNEVQLGRITYILIGEEANLERNKKALEGNKSALEQRLAEVHEHLINNIKGAMNPQQVEKFDVLKLADKL